MEIFVEAFREHPNDRRYLEKAMTMPAFYARYSRMEIRRTTVFACRVSSRGLSTVIGVLFCFASRGLKTEDRIFSVKQMNDTENDGSV